MLGIAFEIFVVSSPLSCLLIHNRNIFMLLFKVKENSGGNGRERTVLDDLNSRFCNANTCFLFSLSKIMYMKSPEPC